MCMGTLPSREFENHLPNYVLEKDSTGAVGNYARYSCADEGMSLRRWFRTLWKRFSPIRNAPDSCHH